MIVTNKINEARKQIQKIKQSEEQELVLVRAQNDEFNRKILENPDVDILVGPELHDRKDRLKQRDSGLNEVLCKLATKNNIKIVISIQEIIKLPPKQKAIALSRVIQNIKLCKRTKTPIILYPNGFEKQDIIALFLTLKSSTQQAKKAFDF